LGKVDFIQYKPVSPSGDEAEPCSLYFKDGELVFGIDYDTVNDYDAVYAFLKENL
jgi:hypothetical protein